MRRIRQLFRLLLVVAFILIGIMAVRTASFSSKQITVQPLSSTTKIPDAALQRFAQAVQIPTISGEKEVDTLAFYMLDTIIQENYPLVDSLLDKQYFNQFSLVFKWPGRNPQLSPVLLMAHMDVVPVEPSSESNWAVPAFGGLISDGFIWGRGSIDDKSSVFSILESVEFLLQENYLPERTIWLSFGHDEEVSGKGAQTIAEYFKKEGIRFEYVLDEGLVVLEKAMPGLEPPLALIGIAEKGATTLSLTARLEDGGHSSMPPRETAVGILSKAITELQENPFPAKIEGPIADFFEYVGPELSWPFRILFANHWLAGGLIKQQLGKEPGSNALLRTTTAPTVLRGGVRSNVLPTEANAKVNFRIRPGETVTSVADYVRKTINDERVTVEVLDATTACDPSPISETHAFGFEVLQKTTLEVFPGCVVAPSVVLAHTDSYHFTDVADNIYRFQPILLAKSDLKRVHGINERLSIENYKRMIRFYRQLILNSCK